MDDKKDIIAAAQAPIQPQLGAPGMDAASVPHRHDGVDSPPIDARFLELPVYTTVPTFSAPEGNPLIYSDGTTRRLYFYVNGGWRYVSFGTAAEYGEIYYDGASTVTFTLANNYYGISAGSNGQETTNVDADASNYKIVVAAAGAGIYRASFSCSFSGNTLTSIITGAILLDGAEQTNLKFKVTVGVANGVVECTAVGLLNVPAGGTVTGKLQCDTAGATASVKQYNLTLVKV